MIFIVVSLLILITIPLGLWPKVTISDRAWNSMFSITMPQRIQGYEARWNAVLAQEFVEFYLSWILAILVAAPLAYALTMFTPFALAAPILLLVTWHVRNIPAIESQSEYIGHAVTVMKGKLDILEEARHMRVAYPKLFKGLSTEQVAARIESRKPIAAFFTDLLHGRIKNGKV